MEHLQVKTSLQACLLNVQLETFCTLGTMLIMMQQLVIKNQNIKDFFNTKKFPGKRAIYKGAMSNLEIAITADGVNSWYKVLTLLYRKLEAMLVLIEL